MTIAESFGVVGGDVPVEVTSSQTGRPDVFQGLDEHLIVDTL